MLESIAPATSEDWIIAERTLLKPFSAAFTTRSELDVPASNFVSENPSCSSRGAPLWTLFIDFRSEET